MEPAGHDSYDSTSEACELKARNMEIYHEVELEQAKRPYFPTFMPMAKSPDNCALLVKAKSKILYTAANQPPDIGHLGA